MQARWALCARMPAALVPVHRTPSPHSSQLSSSSPQSMARRALFGRSHRVVAAEPWGAGDAGDRRVVENKIRYGRWSASPTKKALI